MKKVFVYDIVWDTDGDDVDLPHELTATLEKPSNQTISDLLSDVYGYCHCGFNWYIVEG